MSFMLRWKIERENTYEIFILFFQWEKKRKKSGFPQKLKELFNVERGNNTWAY